MLDRVWSPCRFSQGELEKLDSEGRVVLTDHGGFVLVNVYGPAISTEDSAEERYAFKLQFYKVRQSCRDTSPRLCALLCAHAACPVRAQTCSFTAAF